MTDEDAFLRAILSDPTHPAPRLVYADWLDERGDANSVCRAEYLRVACQLDRLPSADLARHRLQARLRRLRKRVGAHWWRQLDWAKLDAVLKAVHWPGWPAEPGNPPSSQRWVTTPSPTWSDIEDALLRLDRGQWPCVILSPTPIREHEWPKEYFEVIGGQDEYALWVHQSEQKWYPHDPSRGDDMVWVWESIPGASSQPRSTLCGLNEAAAAMRHYAEIGQLWPGLRWVEMTDWPPE
jgi:uncharacterized protein (TIGR02996 family)